MHDLINQFNNISLIKCFEIQDQNGEYHVFDIWADSEGLNTYGASLDWNDCFSLDEHIQELHEKCQESVGVFTNVLDTSWRS